MKLTTSEVFNKVFKGNPNFITPNFCGYYKGNGYFIELSEGNGMDNKPLYGVTVIKEKDNKYNQDYDKCDCFKSVENAQSYIDSLIK